MDTCFAAGWSLFCPNFLLSICPVLLSSCSLCTRGGEPHEGPPASRRTCWSSPSAPPPGTSTSSPWRTGAASFSDVGWGEARFLDLFPLPDNLHLGPALVLTSWSLPCTGGKHSAASGELGEKPGEHRPPSQGIQPLPGTVRQLHPRCKIGLDPRPERTRFASTPTGTH